MSDFKPSGAVEALADAWASIDGKTSDFRRGKTAKSIMAYGGRYAGYMADTEELIKRLLARGYWLAPMEPDEEMVKAGDQNLNHDGEDVRYVFVAMRDSFISRQKEGG